MFQPNGGPIINLSLWTGLAPQVKENQYINPYEHQSAQCELILLTVHCSIGYFNSVYPNQSVSECSKHDKPCTDILLEKSGHTSEEDLEPDLVRDMKTLSSLMMTKCTSLMELRSFFLDTSCKEGNVVQTEL